MEFLSDFHFLRPWWLLAVLPAALLTGLFYLYRTSGSSWQRAIDSELLKQLLDREPGRLSTVTPWVLLLAWLLACLAMAGPVWRQLPQPVHEKKEALIVLLDLSLSMYAEDLKPDRLTQARRKLRNLLAERKEGFTALIVYAGDAHTVTPLTDDTATIELMLNALAPDIMPVPGSRLGKALQVAADLPIEGMDTGQGRILVMTDQVYDPEDALESYRKIRHRYTLSLLGIGTPEGGAIALPNEYLNLPAGYLRGNDGRLILPKLDETSLRRFASEAGGRYRRISLADDDLGYLLADLSLPGADNTSLSSREFDIWQEEGPWLLLVLLPLAALGFRRGWIWCLLLYLPETTFAASWTDSWRSLWSTSDQQAQAEFNKGEYQQARDQFRNSEWRAAAAYRAEDYTVAAQAYESITAGREIDHEPLTPEELTSRYNLGNALAQQGRFAEAIAAYDSVLEQTPEHEDAAFNKALLEDLLQEQQSQQQQESSNESDADQEEGQEESRQQDMDSSGNEESETQETDEQADQADRNQQQEEEEASAQASEQLAKGEEETETSEEQEALQQWLRRVPDDPGGLLKEKFRRQARARLRAGQLQREQEQPW